MDREDFEKLEVSDGAKAVILTLTGMDDASISTEYFRLWKEGAEGDQFRIKHSALTGDGITTKDVVEELAAKPLEFIAFMPPENGESVFRLTPRAHEYSDHHFNRT